MLFIGNNLRLDGTPLRSGGVFCRSLSCTTSFPELGFAVCHLRCRLFPEPLFSSLKSGNLPSAQTARIFTFTSQMLFIGNNLRLDGIPLRSSRCFLKVAVLHYFLSGVGVCCMPAALPLISKGRWGRGLARAGFEGRLVRRACLPGRLRRTTWRGC